MNCTIENLDTIGYQIGNQNISSKYLIAILTVIMKGHFVRYE